MSRVLEEFPSIALRDFYLSPEFKEFHAVYKTGEIQDLVDRMGKSAAVAILEGTGITLISGKSSFIKREFSCLWPRAWMVKSTRRSLGGTDNKDDELDASSDV
jgi:hypothetical protein